jgi:hypothetical protein
MRDITGRWWKIEAVYFNWDWGNWLFGWWAKWSYLRKTGIDIGPLQIDFDHERIVKEL